MSDGWFSRLLLRYSEPKDMPEPEDQHYKPPKTYLDVVLHGDAALEAQIAAIFDRLDDIQQEIRTMSQTLEQQVQAATAAIQVDLANAADAQVAIAAQIAALQAQLTAGSTVTQADVDALGAVKDSADQLAAGLQGMVTPPAGP